MTQSIEIRRVLRRVRGGSQAFLAEGADGQYYVAKFQGNPQGTRTLVNEWIGWRIFQRLGITTPELRVLRLTESLRDRLPELYFSVGRKTVAVLPGRHLGSRCPCDPETTAIYDVLPNKFLARAANLSDFAKAFVVDHLLGNSDSRQAVFVRPRGESAFQAYLIDHGMLFGGSEWTIRDSPRAAVYFDRTVYSAVDMAAVCGEAIAALKTVEQKDLHSAVAELPGDWLTADDYRALHGLFREVLRRQTDAEAIIARHLKELRLDSGFERTRPEGITLTEAPEPPPVLPILPATC